MAKPFSIQSPEDIAKQYAGNKKKIGEAMQMGIIDPTAGVLAGMFIDRMRGAQVQEGANPPTVAQQVMGGLPPAPSAPLPPAGGIGAPAQGGLPMTPDMSAMAPDMAAMAPAPEAPMGMAAGGAAYAPPYMMGGLDGLPIPDTMFDENRNGGYDDGYAHGGIVAFGSGGYTLDSAWARIKKIEGGLGPNGEMRVSPAGAVGPAQLMPDTAPEAARLAGLPWDENRYRTDPNYNEALGKAYFASRVAARKGDYEKAALDYHSGMGNVDKGKIGPAGREYLRQFTEDAVPERDQATAAGRLGSLEDIVAAVQGINRKSADELGYEQRVKARLEEKASDEYYEKQRKADMWQTLAEIGFNMASSKSPYVLQAIGEAAAASMPGARADKKDRKEAKDRALEGLMELGARNRKEAMDALQVAIPVWQAGMSAEQFQQKMGLESRQLDLESQKLDILRKQAEAKQTTPEALVMSMYFSGNPALKSQAEGYLKLLHPGGAQQQGGSIEDAVKNAQGAGGQGGNTIDFSQLTQ